MGAQCSSPAAIDHAIPAQPQRIEPPAIISAAPAPDDSNIHRPQPRRPVAQRPQPRAPAPAAAETNSERWLESVETELFKACSLRDQWLRADPKGEAFQALHGEWIGERSKSRKADHGREAMIVHCKGSVVAAVVHTSPFASIGEILFVADATARTVTQFGVPGFEATVGSTRCVMLLEEAGKHTVLYFYAGQECCLRCWRRSGTSDSDSEDDSKEGGPAASTGAADAGSVGAPTAKVPRPAEGGKAERHKAGWHGKKQRAVLSHQDEDAGQRSDAAVGERVSRWAAGKDLAGMLGTLGDFSRDFSTALPQPEVSALRGSQAALRKAYHGACLRLHPDKLVDGSQSTQAVALALFQSLSAAFVASQSKEKDLSC